jgi:signal peptidase I
MADNNIPQTTEPPAPTSVPPAETAAAGRSELEQFLRWGAGLILVLCMGWGLIAGVAYAAYRANVRLDLSIILLAASFLSLVILILLEHNLWLSRFMGLRVDARSSPYKQAFFLWLFGVPGLLWRSTENREAAADQKTQSDVSNTREVIETIVFVVVLVLLLKSFVAEAFVIPTGSMATTLYGYQKTVKCPKCDHVFPVNCSQEVDPQEGERTIITGCTCPNCRFPIPLAKEKVVTERDSKTGQQFERTEWTPLLSSNTGDRVLVAKFLYDLPWNSPENNRLNVVVFKYPERPQKDYTPMNYIKRLIGLPGETIGIYYGKLYILPPPPDKRPRYDDSDVPEVDHWQYKNMHVQEDSPDQIAHWKDFRILRKPTSVVMAQRRLVYDNDTPASDLKDWPRWQDKSGNKAWVEDAAARTFKHAAAADGDLAWLRYRHVIARSGRTKPELITDFIGYNSYEPQPAPQTQHWVGDLMLDCDVTIDKPEGELALELSRGSARFRALFNLATGECTLRQLKKNKDETPADGAGEVLGDTKPTALKKSGTYHVRFANVDDRLLLWVDHDLPFGEGGQSYTAAEDRGPTPENDLLPASVGVKGGGVTVGKLQLWRDTYYTQMQQGGRDDYPSVELADPATWGPLHHLKAMALYVQPGHYLCLGDNSPHSSDGRAWGLVPDRLVLGRALVVYYPFPPMGNRAGPIH